jgi:2-polyprenyl-6-methoxyphenol hydroxylase-like FAD-dependent oxidoreductase
MLGAVTSWRIDKGIVMAAVDNPIIIVGGGLGGLTAALALGLQGRRVRVLEQASKIAPIGYGIQLGPNVFPIFESLGIAEAVLRLAYLPRHIIMAEGDSGDTLIDIPLTGGEYSERFRHPYVVVHRADLHNVLLDACRALFNVEISVSVTATDFEDHGDGVTVRCEDGGCVHGSALIAADGLRSRVREQIVADGEPRPVGYVAHRTVVDMSLVPSTLPFRDDVVLWAGPGCHVVHYPLRGRTLFNIVAVFKNPGRAANSGPAEHVEQAQYVYRDAHPSLKTLLSFMNLERRWDICDRAPTRHWVTGRVTLLGDAAHPTLQSLAQGACMAIEGAASLAAALHEAGDDYTQAFKQYEQRCLLRTARVQLESRTLWEFYHAEGVARDVRNATARSRRTEDHYRCLEWLWLGSAHAA